jgi:GT2 family glycosyltransferase
MRIAVLIVNWNSWPLLARTLRALAEQSLGDFEVIVADNGSADPLPETFTIEFPNVVFLSYGENLGFAAANNRLLEYCRDAEWVALLNPDAFPEPHWLESLREAVPRYPEYACFASRLVSADDPRILDGDGDIYHCSGLAWRAGHGRRVPMEAGVREIFGACAAAALYRRSAVMDVGGFDEDFFCYFEDVDLSFRLRLAGHRSALVPNAVAHHLGSATSGGKHSDFALYHGHRNLVWTFIKNMPGGLFWGLLPLHLALNVASLLWFAARGRGGVLFRAKRDALAGIPRMWKKRQAIQARRRASLMDLWKVLDKGWAKGTG